MPQWVRWNWRGVRPQAPYLAFLAIGQYEVRQATAPNGQTLITVYDDVFFSRGAMTLQALRSMVGDDVFFAILRTWIDQHKDSTATTDEFIALAEQLSGQQLDDLFTTWLYTAGKPPVGPNGHTGVPRVDGETQVV